MMSASFLPVLFFHDAKSMVYDSDYRSHVFQWLHQSGTDYIGGGSLSIQCCRPPNSFVRWASAYHLHRVRSTPFLCIDRWLFPESSFFFHTAGWLWSDENFEAKSPHKRWVINRSPPQPFQRGSNSIRSLPTQMRQHQKSEKLSPIDFLDSSGPALSAELLFHSARERSFPGDQ